MQSRLRMCWLVLIVAIVAGCNDANAPKTADAGGTVTYKGAPLAGAVVTFVPEKGPIAMGKTDLEGKFSLRTGGLDGAVLGPARVAITVPGEGADDSAPPPPPENASPEEARAYAMKMQEVMKQASINRAQSKPKSDSLIPAKYTSADTSGLTVTVSEDSSQNHFVLDLK